MAYNITRFSVTLDSIDIPEKFNAALSVVQNALNGGSLHNAIDGTVLDILATPPVGPSDGDTYLVASASATGDWVGKENQIAYWLDSYGEWLFITAGTGNIIYIQDDAQYRLWNGSLWAVTTITSFDQSLNTTDSPTFANLSVTSLTVSSLYGIDSAGVFTGFVATPIAGDSTTKPASTAFVQGEISTALAALVGTAPGVLDTLGEIADALNDDADVYNTLLTQINTKIASSANLVAISGLAGAADKLPYFTGSGAMTTTTLTSYSRTLLDDADATAWLATLGIPAVSQAEAEAGSSTSLRSWTPQRVAQAIAALAGSSAVNFIGSATSAGAATIELDGLFSDTSYDEFLIIGMDIINFSAGSIRSLIVEFKISGAWVAAGPGYSRQYLFASSTTVTGNLAAFPTLDGGVVPSTSHTAGEHAELSARLTKPSDTTKFKQFSGNICGMGKISSFNVRYTSLNAVTGVRFLDGTNNISGTFHVYGVKNSA